MRRVRKNLVKRLDKTISPEKEYLGDIFKSYHSIQIGKRYYFEEEIETLFNPVVNGTSTDHVGLFKKVFQTLYPITRTRDGLPKKPRDEGEKTIVVKGLENRKTQLRLQIVKHIQDKGNSINLREEIEHLEDIIEIINHLNDTTMSFPYNQLQLYIDNPDIAQSSDFDEEMNRLKMKQKENTRVRNLLRQFAKLYLQEPYKSEFEIYDPGLSKRRFETYLGSIDENKSVPLSLGNFIRFLRGDKTFLSKIGSAENSPNLIKWLDDIQKSITDINLSEDVREEIVNELILKLKAAAEAAEPTAAPEIPRDTFEGTSSSQSGGYKNLKLDERKKVIDEKITAIVKALEQRGCKEDLSFLTNKYKELETQLADCTAGYAALMSDSIERGAELTAARDDLEAKEKKRAELQARLNAVRTKLREGVADPDDISVLEETLLEGKINGLNAEIAAQGAAVSAAQAAATAAQASEAAAKEAKAAVEASLGLEKSAKEAALDALLELGEEGDAAFAELIRQKDAEKDEALAALTVQKDTEKGEALAAAREASDAALAALREEKERALAAATDAATTAAAAAAAEIAAAQADLQALRNQISGAQLSQRKVTFLMGLFNTTKEMAEATARDAIENIYETLMSTIAQYTEATDDEKKILNETINAIKPKLIDAYNKEADIARLTAENTAALAAQVAAAEQEAARVAAANAAALAEQQTTFAAQLAHATTEAAENATNAAERAAATRLAEQLAAQQRGFNDQLAAVNRAAAAATSAAERAAADNLRDALLRQKAESDAALAAANREAEAAAARAKAAADAALAAERDKNGLIEAALAAAGDRIRSLEAELASLRSAQAARSAFAYEPTSSSQRRFPGTDPSPVEPPVAPYRQPPVQIESIFNNTLNKILNNTTIKDYYNKKSYLQNTTKLSELLSELDTLKLFNLKTLSSYNVNKAELQTNQNIRRLLKLIDDVDGIVDSIIRKSTKLSIIRITELGLNPSLKYTLIPKALINNANDENKLKNTTDELMTALFSLNSQRGGDLRTLSMNIANDRFDDNFLEETNPFYRIIEDFNKSSKMNIQEEANEKIMMSRFLDKFLKEYFDTDEMKEFYYQALTILNKKSCDKISNLCFRLLDICHSISEADKNIDVVRLDNITLNAEVDELEIKIKEHSYDFFENAKKQFPDKKEISIGFFKDHVYFYMETNKFDKMYSIDEKHELHIQNYDFNEEIYYLNNHLLFLFYIICAKLHTHKKYDPLDSYVRKTKRSKTKRLSTLLKERKANKLDERD